MNSSTLRNLGLVLVALVAVLLWLELADDTAQVSTGKALFPDLRARVNDVEQLAVDRPDAEQVVITRTDDGWAVENRGGYAADVARVREVLLALADAKVLEEKTANPDLYPALGVSDPEAEGSQGLRLTASGEAVEYAVVIGNANPGSGRYVRPAGEATSLLIDTDPNLPEDASGWLRTDLPSVATGDVASVTIEHSDGETLSVSKATPEDANFTVADIPEGRELSYATVANGVGGALNDLVLEDVRRAEGGDVDTVTTVTTFDGLVLRVTAYDAGEDPSWFAFDASYQAPVVVDEAASAETDAVTDGDAAGGEDAATDADETGDEEASDGADASARAAEFNARTSGWEFRLPSYKANLLTRHWEDILKAEESEEDAAQ